MGSNSPVTAIIVVIAVAVSITIIIISGSSSSSSSHNNYYHNHHHSFYYTGRGLLFVVLAADAALECARASRKGQRCTATRAAAAFIGHAHLRQGDCGSRFGAASQRWTE